jgi:hypothetical protein
MFRQFVLIVLIAFWTVTAYAQPRNYAPPPAPGVSPPSATTPSASAEEKGAYDGFRGIKWKDDVETVPDLVPFKDYGNGFIEYTRKGEKLAIGAVVLEEIRYGFYKGSLACVTIISKLPVRTYGSEGDPQMNAMHDILLRRYGGKDNNRYRWNKDDVFIYLLGDHSLPDANGIHPEFISYTNWWVEMQYAPLVNQMRHDIAAAKKTAKDASEKAAQKDF